MPLRSRAIFSDAVALWRAQRDVILPIAGVFYLLPILALAMLATGLALPETATREEVRGAIDAFLLANFVWLLMISVAVEFGTLALLNLMLRRESTVAGVLRAALVRLLPFVLLGFANGAVMQLGFTLFVLPGIYVFGRTWMMGAAYATAPERGLLGAVERGFRLSSGNGWRIAACGLGVAIIMGAGAMALLIVTQMVVVIAGGATMVQAVLLVPVAAAATAAYIGFTLVRIAIYRALAGSSSGT